MSKVWFVTGASRGFGRVWVEAALERGDRVAATARHLADVQDLAEKHGENVLPLELDVQDRDAVHEAVRTTVERFGRIDVAVNNAGYGLFGLVEEVPEEMARDQLETNLFGALWVTQAVLPTMREQGSGHIIQVSSIGGITAFPMVGLYHASKWALEGFSQSLAQEVAGFGIHVTLIEPGGFSTDWAGDSAKHAPELDAYADYREKVMEGRRNAAGSRGNPDATGPVVLELVDMAEPPLRIFFGSSPLETAKKDYASRIETWEAHQDLAERAQG